MLSESRTVPQMGQHYKNLCFPILVLVFVCLFWFCKRAVSVLSRAGISLRTSVWCLCLRLLSNVTRTFSHSLSEVWWESCISFHKDNLEPKEPLIGQHQNRQRNKYNYGEKLAKNKIPVLCKSSDGDEQISILNET